MTRPGSSRIAVVLLASVLPAAWLVAGSPQSRAAGSAKFSASAIEINNVGSEELKLPPEFQMALYEHLIATIEKTGKFQRVFREGDRLADGVPDLVILRTNVRGFKKGSERQRQVTTVAGATSIKVHLEIATRDGQRLVDQDAEGKVRFFGENLRATYNLAKAVAKIVDQKFQAPAAATKPASK